MKRSIIKKVSSCVLSNLFATLNDDCETCKYKLPCKHISKAFEDVHKDFRDDGTLKKGGE